VQRALREDRLVFAYQPVVDAQTRETAYYECLLRLVQPNGDIDSACDFMPVVEELGMIRAVDLRVLELAVRDLSENPSVRLALNVSGLTATDLHWRRSAVAMLRDKPLLASRLVVEITETAGLEDMEECARFVRTLRQLGCKVALDDFGAGYTSFSHLKSLAVDLVKIDGSFVRGIAENPSNLMFVRTLLELVRNFNLGSVAECVETEEEIRLLTQEGVNYLQGNAVGEPRLGQPWPAARGAVLIAKTG
jgi:EAL domain-containing protein (putative c-di-GMP-specific phosphodiesterase class I)